MFDMLKEYSRLFLFFMLLNASMLTTTVVLHELGHLFVGYVNGCTGRVVLIDLKTDSTFSEIDCQKEVNSDLISLGAYLFVIPFSVLFLFLDMPEKNYFFIISGLGLMTSALDLMNIFNSNISFYGSILVGSLFMIYGEVKLVNERIFKLEEMEIGNLS